MHRAQTEHCRAWGPGTAQKKYKKYKKKYLKNKKIINK